MLTFPNRSDLLDGEAVAVLLAVAVAFFCCNCLRRSSTIPKHIILLTHILHYSLTHLQCDALCQCARENEPAQEESDRHTLLRSQRHAVQVASLVADNQTQQHHGLVWIQKQQNLMRVLHKMQASIQYCLPCSISC